MKTLIIAAMLLATTAAGHTAEIDRDTTPRIGETTAEYNARTSRKAEIDYMPWLGETTAEYNARTSGDPAKMHAFWVRKEQEALAAAKRDALCADRNTTISSRTYNGRGSSSSETTYRYIPGC